MTKQIDLMQTQGVELKDTSTTSLVQNTEVIVKNIVTGEVITYETLGKATAATGEYGRIILIQSILNDKDKSLSYPTFFIYRYANDPRDFSDAIPYRDAPGYIVKNYLTGKIYKLNHPRQVENVLGKSVEYIFAYQHKNGVNSRLFKNCFLILDENKERIYWPKLEPKIPSTRKKTT